ncbi:MAG: ligase-associated DNA damage response endonuclease PdeM [Verrucomicrobiales bacterium]
MPLHIRLAGESIGLFPERGLFWERGRCLLIADWHIGKAATFRAAGIGVPDGDLDEEFARLDQMLEASGATELVILGDLAHARAGLSEGLAGRMRDWISGCGARVGLVAGNHDHSAGLADLRGFGLDLLGDSLQRGPFTLQHEPAAGGSEYVLAGHLHPAIRLGEGKRGGVRAPCFWFGAKAGVLPAFGGFTGGKRINAVPGDRVFAVGGSEVIEIPT